MRSKVRTMEVPSEGIDQGIEYLRNTMLKMASGIDGFRGMVGLVDRETGKAITVTLWDDDAALEASEEGGARLRGEGGAPPVKATVEKYDVVVAQFPADVSV